MPRNLKERIFEVLSEAGKTGLDFEIVIIREGKSKNGTFYPKETLLKSREMFEGAKVAFYNYNGMFDHLSEEAKAMIPHGFPTQIAGIVHDVKFSKLSDGGHGLIGTLSLTETNKWLGDIFKLGLQKGNQDVLGFSIDVLGTSEERTVEGEKVDYVTDIGQVNEVTVVTNPAAGGRLERMVASVNAKKENQIMKELFFRLIAALSPKKLDGVSFAESDEAKLKETARACIDEAKATFKENPQMMAALQTVLAALDAGDVEKAKTAVKETLAMYADASKSAPPAQKQSEDVKKKETDSSGAEIIAISKKQDELLKKIEESDKATQETRRHLSEAILKAELSESNLPDAAKERLKDKFTGKVFEKADLKKDIDGERKYAARLYEGLHPHGLKLEVGESDLDKLGDAIQGMLADKDINKVPRFRSLHEAYAKFEKKSPYEAGFKDQLWISMVETAKTYDKKKALKEAIANAGFTEVLADRLHKQMVVEYGEAGLDDWRKITTVSSAPDFLTQRRVRLGGYGTNMPTVAEAAAYTALTSPTDEEATFTVAKRGGLETISMEAIKNDNLNAFRMIPKRLGRGCANTLYQFVFALIDPAVNAAIYDTVALYNAGHGANLRTVALSYAEFYNHAQVLFDQAGYNEANFFIDNNPKYILVPNELWIVANEIAKSGESLSAGRAETVDNQYSMWNLEVIRVPYWTDNNNWATVADPTKSPGLEVGFLDGNEQPELLQEVSNAGTDFTNDQLRYKVRHIYGGAVTDFRPFVGAVVP